MKCDICSEPKSSLRLIENPVDTIHCKACDSCHLSYLNGIPEFWNAIVDAQKHLGWAEKKYERKIKILRKLLSK